MQAKYMTVDLKILHLNTPLKQYEYLWLKVDDIPRKFQTAVQVGWKKQCRMGGYMWKSTKECMAYQKKGC